MPTTTPPPARSGDPGRSSAILRALQRCVASAFGITEAAQHDGLAEMLRRSAKEAPSYWLQLVLAMGIATLGLVLGSTAVVIGAMLISPLMGPIVELGMGLAVGSPLLVVRSGARVTVSVFVVIALSAFIVYVLPFHEVTKEISSRTTPNALDLFIAIFCAVAAAYTTTQRGSATAATAAGTAIGIALVPPLCVVGYGFGTLSSTIAGGAALLFTANLCAILLFAVLVFLLLGYNRIDVLALEAAEHDRGGSGALRYVAGVLLRLFHARYGTLLRVLMPLALIGFIIVPLRSALLEVAWQVRVRAAIQQMVTAVRASVRNTVSLERHTVTVHLVVVGSPKDAEALEANLTTRIAEVSGVKPYVNVLAVPDLATMKALAADAAQPPAPNPVATPDLGDARRLATQSMNRHWPAAAGVLVRWSLDFRPTKEVLFHVVHLGAPLGPSGEQLLGASLTSDVGGAVQIDERTFPSDPVVADFEGTNDWLTQALVLIGRTADEPLLHACVETPEVKEMPAHERKDVERAHATLRAALSGRDPIATVAGARQWQLTIKTEPCVVATPAASSSARGAASAPH